MKLYKPPLSLFFFLKPSFCLHFNPSGPGLASHFIGSQKLSALNLVSPLASFNSEELCDLRKCIVLDLLSLCFCKMS